MAIRIAKPITYSDDEFIELLSESAQKSNSVITYELLEDRDEYVNINFYTTEDIYLEKSNYMYNVYIGDFSEIEQYNLNSCLYYVKSDDVSEFCDVMQGNGIYCEITDENVSVKRYLTLNNIFVPVIIILIDFGFIVMANIKTYLVKRRMGYSIFGIGLEFCGNVFIRMIGIALLVIMILLACIIFI